MISCDIITVAASIAESPSFATRGSIANLNIGLSLAKMRWRKAIERQITLLRIQKNGKCEYVSVPVN